MFSLIENDLAGPTSNVRVGQKPKNLSRFCLCRYCLILCHFNCDAGFLSQSTVISFYNGSMSNFHITVIEFLCKQLFLHAEPDPRSAKWWW